MVSHCCLLNSHIFCTLIKNLQLKIIVKVHGVFPSSCNKPASSRVIQIHQVYIGDSGEVVTPFMQVGTYPTRNFATFGPSELQPPFTGDSINCKCNFIFTLQHRAGVSLYTSFFKLAETCVFIKQSLLLLKCQ